MDSITTAWNALAPTIDELRKEVPWADTRIESLAKQTGRSAVDDQVLQDLRKTGQVLETVSQKSTALGTVVAEWPRMQARQTITADDAHGYHDRDHNAAVRSRHHGSASAAHTANGGSAEIR